MCVVYTSSFSARRQDGQEVALSSQVDRCWASSRWRNGTNTKEREAREVYRTIEDARPGVARLHRQGDVLLSGDVWLLNRPPNAGFAGLCHDPAEARRMFASRGWRRVVGFQTRNPITP